MVRLVLGVAALICLMVCGVAGAAVNSDLYARVNERMRPGERFAFSRRNDRAVRQAYALLYPDGPRVRRAWVLVGVALLAWFVIVACMFLPRD
jgi:hypothetical protein